MGLGGRGHLIAWTENGQDKWEWADDPEMVVYLYDKAVAACGEDAVFLFEAKVLNKLQTSIEMQMMRDILKRSRG